MLFSHAFWAIPFAAQTLALSIGGNSFTVKRASDGLQDIVTWDASSLFVYGERIFIFSGEFHPYRLPVPDLWLDVFQKVKALGFNAVSFYSHWALLEGEPGVYTAEGIFAYEPFFDAAKEAGIFLIARPGPYINAESSGGGFPGWLQRTKGELRTRAPDYLAATDLYAAKMGATIAKGQITNGGPIILVQPENEYTGAVTGNTGGFPDPVYFKYVEDQLRKAGVTVPFISNDAHPQGYFAPGFSINGTTDADVNIYGHDSYPQNFDCANPYVWGAVPTNFHATHLIDSPSTFYSLNEYQGGSFDPWGGLGFDQCAILLNMEFERVFYKNNFASGVTLLNLYMIYGGTNWGNHGHSGGYTSYDYGSPITENREITREKYSELKLEANFVKVTPAYLTASVQNAVNGTWTNNNQIFTTPLKGNGSASNFYIVRHSDAQLKTAATYQLTVNTSQGLLTIPQLGGNLTLSGRDSKWHVTDYNIGADTVLYSTAEIFTWKQFSDRTALIVYGGPGELHELAINGSKPATVLEGDVKTVTVNGSTILNWQTSTTRAVVQIGSIFVYVLDRNTAYNYWVPDFVRTDKWLAYSSPINTTTSVIVEAGYLIRSVAMSGSTLQLQGDLNATTPLRIIGAPTGTTSVEFNGQKLAINSNPTTGELTSTLTYDPPTLNLPALSSLKWKYLDNLPEIHSNYSDELWTVAKYNTTNNPTALRTPVSLYGSDYGFHTGVLIFRGHFIASGKESSLNITTQGGSAFGSSVWLNNTYIGSWSGIDKASNWTASYTLPNLNPGAPYVFTVVVDNTGLDENWVVGSETMKNPRGILNYTLSSRSQSDITWKLTGNLGGEKYVDKIRGPLNEGGLYAERQGFTQPQPPSTSWASSSPETGISQAGIAFYSASVDLALPAGYDVPLSFNFGNSTTTGGATSEYRVQLWVNGYQFGKYTNGIGPQKSFPVPQGILNYNGTNWIGIELWAQQANGAQLTNFTLVAGKPVLTAMKVPSLTSAPKYVVRKGAY